MNSVRVSNRLLIRSLTTDASGNLSICQQVQPSDYRWFQTIATLYEKWSPVAWTFVFEPSISLIVASGAGVGGYDYDVTDPPPADMEALSSYGGAIHFSARDAAGFPFQPRAEWKRELLCDNAGEGVTTDAHLYNQATFYLIMNGCPVSCVIGQLFLQATIRFSVPQVHDVATLPIWSEIGYGATPAVAGPGPSPSGLYLSSCIGNRMFEAVKSYTATVPDIIRVLRAGCYWLDFSMAGKFSSWSTGAGAWAALSPDTINATYRDNGLPFINGVRLVPDYPSITATNCVLNNGAVVPGGLGSVASASTFWNSSVKVHLEVGDTIQYKFMTGGTSVNYEPNQDAGYGADTFAAVLRMTADNSQYQGTAGLPYPRMALYRGPSFPALPETPLPAALTPISRLVCGASTSTATDAPMGAAQSLSHPLPPPVRSRSCSRSEPSSDDEDGTPSVVSTASLDALRTMSLADKPAGSAEAARRKK